jgi:hypothetical protein
MDEFNKVAEALLKMYPESATPFLQTTHGAPEPVAPAGTFKEPGTYRMQITAVDIIEPCDQKTDKVEKFAAMAKGQPVEIQLAEPGQLENATLYKCQAASFKGKYKEPYTLGGHSKLHVIMVGCTTVNLYETEFKRQ